MSNAKELFAELKKEHFPKKTMQVPDKQVDGIAFFPVGSGTLDCKGEISNKKIMILGQDFDTVENMDKVIQKGHEDINKNKTWKNLLEFLKEVKIDKQDCFFTNAFPAARLNQTEKKNSNTGQSPAFKDEQFLKDSKKFFKKQIQRQEPKVILVLGIHVAKFLSEFVIGKKWDSIKRFKDVDDDVTNQLVTLKIDDFETKAVLLLHPCLRKSNIRFRTYNSRCESKEKDVEVEMMKYFLKEIQLGN